jgi:hypothetical protein
MSKVLLSTAYMPNIPYFTKLIEYNTIYLEAHENFPKQTYRNRCEIATANGLLSLTVPVVAARIHKTPIKEVLIDYSENWQQKHINAIRSAYKNSPFYEFYCDEIFDALCKKQSILFDYNLSIINTLMTLIGFEKPISFTNTFVHEPDYADFRNTISPKNKSSYLDTNFKHEKYYQVFENKNGFIPNLSVLDLIFNEGPLSYSIIKKSIC